MHPWTPDGIGHVRRLAIVWACSLTVVTPAWASPPRPYQGPLQPQDAPAEPTVQDAASPVLESPEGSVAAESDEGEIDQWGEQDEDDAIDLGRIDWRDAPQGGVVLRQIRGGALLTTSGLLLVFGSIILGTLDPCRRLAGNGCQREARTRAALTMGLPGGLLLAAGATLLGIGLERRQRLRTSVRIGAAAGRRGGGLTLAGRF